MDFPKYLREYDVTFHPAEDSRADIDRDDENLGRRTKFGGRPSAIQGEDEWVPKCPQCHAPMHFVAQIDSFEHQSPQNPHAKPFADQHFMFADVGMIYVWFCFECLVPTATLDSY